MADQELDQRKKELEAFGHIIAQHHRQRAEHKAQQPPPGSVALGRYLSASRKSAGFSIEALSRHTKLSTTVLLGLEQGLFFTEDIQPNWLKRLAHVLEEDVDDLNLLLGYCATEHVPHQSLLGQWLETFWPPPAALIFRRPLISLYAVIWISLICFATVTMLRYSITLPPSGSAEAQPLFIPINSELRLNMINAEAPLTYQTSNGLIDAPASKNTLLRHQQPY
ncbi:MAG: helix-turn-helix transcriptional regulator [Anaerolineae bacterium]|nr:helix-turn-helix transcriptional regulator [Anaerolineae bacterium]